MKCWWHMFKHHIGYPVWARIFMVRDAAKGFVEDGRGYLANQHWSRGRGGWPDVAEPYKWYPERKCRVQRESFCLQLLKLVITSDGVVRKRPDVSSRRTERSVGSVGLSGLPSEFRRMDLRATFCFFTIM